MSADVVADEALKQCAIAARLHPSMWTSSELYILFGRSTGSITNLNKAPFNTLSVYQKKRLEQWHLSMRKKLPVDTWLRLAAAYSETGDSPVSDDTSRLRSIAIRAGVTDRSRLSALLTYFDWGGDRVPDALHILTEKNPAYPEVYRAFEAEISRVRRLRDGA
jgi:hypothetical protein